MRSACKCTKSDNRHVIYPLDFPAYWGQPLNSLYLLAHLLRMLLCGRSLKKIFVWNFMERDMKIDVSEMTRSVIYDIVI